MAEEIAFENGRISNFEGLVTSLILDGVILHTVMHHSSTYIKNQINFLRTDGRTFETGFIKNASKILGLILCR